MAYLDKLRAYEAQNSSGGSLTKPTEPSGRLQKDPLPVLRGWRASLCTIDPLAPRSGWCASRWMRLYDAGVWWFDAFGEQAARDGWSTGDVFGVLPSQDGWGGLLDRLGDKRKLLMSADRASWRRFGVVQAFNRTAGLGLRPFWEADL